MSRAQKWILIILAIAFCAYIAGPSPRKPEFNTTLQVVPNEPDALEKYVADGEAKHKLKPDNEAKIVWADSSRKKTHCSVVYLHGFGASEMEGSPVNTDFAKKFGCNLYLARLSDHGTDTTDQMIMLTVDRLWRSAKEALAIGKALGDSVIIMSTSTGGTLGLMLAAQYPSDVYALLNMSPNVRVKHPLAFISNNHWGLQVGRMVMHGKFLPYTRKPGVDTVLQKRYWHTTYRLEAVSQLQEMIEDKMTKETFEKIKQPCLSLYYFKDEEHQDQTIKVSAIIEMNSLLGTPENLKEAIAIPEAGDHVIGCYITSKAVPDVERQIDKFAIEKLKMKPLY